MIAWFADNGVGFAKDYWSLGYTPPVEDTVSNISQDSPPMYDFTTSRVSFVTRRALDTGDSD